MRLDRRFLSWGLFFIALGGVPLAVQQGWLDEDVASRAWQLWPLLVVAAGIGLLLRRTSLEPLGGLLASVTAGVMLGGLLAGGFNFVGVGGTCGSQGQAFPAQQGTFAGPIARVRLDFNCGDMRVTTAAGTGWTLNGSSDEGRAPTVAATGDALAIESRDRSGFFLFGGSDRDEWALVLPTDPTIDLESAVNAGSARLDLVQAKLASARFTVNAGIGPRGPHRVHGRPPRRSRERRIGGCRAPELEHDREPRSERGLHRDLCAPGAGLRVSTNDNPTSANNFGDRGLTRTGSTWETPGYNSAAVQIDLRANANAASVTLNPEDGC